MKTNNLKIKYLLNDLAQNNSEDALKYLYAEYFKAIYRYILLFVKSKEITEELISDIFFTIWESRKTLTEIDNFDAYIYKIAKYKSLNYLRSKKITTIDLDQISIDLFTSTITTVENEYISKEMTGMLNDAIEQLPTQCKMVFKLVREDKMKYKDVADFLGISVKTVETHLTKAVKKIKEKLENVI